MREKPPRPVRFPRSARAGESEGFGDAFNSSDSKARDPHQGTKVSPAHADARAATSMPTTERAGPDSADGPAWQHLTPPGQTGLDEALFRLFPAIPDHVRRQLRQPLERWRRAAVRYLQSQRTRSDAESFMAVWFGLPGMYSSKRRPNVGALLGALYADIGQAINRRPCTCRWRQSCALLEVIDWLFLGVKGGEIVHTCPPAQNGSPGDG
jgi:hypothetical protein